jgi:hypothetical protein
VKELLKKLNSEFDDAEGSICIVDADWYSDDLRLSLSISMHDESQAELWGVSCEGVVEESIHSISEAALTVVYESPLLMPYQEIEVDLMFSENSCKPALLLGLLFSTCFEVFGKENYLQRFLNQEPTLKGIVRSKYGKLGRFPKSLADKIVLALKDQPIRVNSIETGYPKKWTGAEFINYPSLVVLELGSSYVITEGFSAVLS